jgi:peptide/nickel transport system substrate-binding protein
LILESLALESEFISGYPLMPAHYMKQFHENYADKDSLRKLLDEGGYENWKLLFESHVEAYWDARTKQNIGAPSLNSYVVSEIGENYIKMVRNPYYWKVDSEGRQLPYIDEMHIQIVGKELYHGKVATGEADFAGRRTSLAELALYKSGEEAGDYKVYLWNAVGDADYMVLLNFNSSNEANRELINNLKFRQALSLAINREDFNEVINYGLAIPQQMTLLPTSKFYKEEYARSYADFNLDKANAMLDDLGLEWDSNHEYRLGPDGKTLSFHLEEGGERAIEASELLGEYWKEVGLKLNIKAVDRDLFHEHLRDNVAIDVHLTKYGMMDGAFIERPNMFLPVGYNDTDVWAPLWAKWRLNKYANEDNQDYEKPPRKILDLIETWEELKIEVDPQEQMRLADILLKSQAENLWTLGITTGGVKPVIASNRLGNFIPDGTYTYDFLQYAQYINADTWYLKNK